MYKGATEPETTVPLPITFNTGHYCHALSVRYMALENTAIGAYISYHGRGFIKAVCYSGTRITTDNSAGIGLIAIGA